MKCYIMNVLHNVWSIQESTQPDNICHVLKNVLLWCLTSNVTISISHHISRRKLTLKSYINSQFDNTLNGCFTECVVDKIPNRTINTSFHYYISWTLWCNIILKRQEHLDTWWMIYITWNWNCHCLYRTKTLICAVANFVQHLHSPYEPDTTMRK